MPETPKLRVAVRAATLIALCAAPSGFLAFQHQPNAAAVATPLKRVVATTTSTTAPPPPPTTTTTAPPVVPPPAPPTTAAPRPVVTAKPKPAPVPPSYSSQTVQQRGEEALALIHYPWQSLGYSISFEAGRDGVLGLTNEGTQVISIYIRDRESLDTLARTIAHEIGHVLDFTRTTDDERAAYIGIRGINATVDSWYGCNECTDFATAAGDWAETFQYWLLGDGQYMSQMGPKPSPEQLAQLAPIFAA